jgi:hypothetical protein
VLPVGLKKILFALIVLSVATAGFAADVENAALPPADGKSSPSGGPSYFEGVWVGKWGWAADGNEITITVGKKNKNGLFGTSYSWESGRLRSGHTMKSGSFKAWGKEQGDQFLIEWKNKEGVKSSITLTKGKEDSVKAVYDSDERISWIRDRADCMAYLTRK